MYFTKPEIETGLLDTAVKYSGRQPNFAVLNRGRHLCLAGRSSRWALTHMLVCIRNLSLFDLCVSILNSILVLCCSCHVCIVSLIMVALCNRANHYILPMVSIFFLHFFPRLISAVGDWMSTILPHMVWP